VAKIRETRSDARAQALCKRSTTANPSACREIARPEGSAAPKATGERGARAEGGACAGEVAAGDLSGMAIVHLGGLTGG
jgi:hypothetical protein